MWLHLETLHAEEDAHEEAIEAYQYAAELARSGSRARRSRAVSGPRATRGPSQPSPPSSGHGSTSAQPPGMTRYLRRDSVRLRWNAPASSPSTFPESASPRPRPAVRVEYHGVQPAPFGEDARHHRVHLPGVGHVRLRSVRAAFGVDDPRGHRPRRLRVAVVVHDHVMPSCGHGGRDGCSDPLARAGHEHCRHTQDHHAREGDLGAELADLRVRS
jgi:hypothetical protein